MEKKEKAAKKERFAKRQAKQHKRQTVKKERRDQKKQQEYLQVLADFSREHVHTFRLLLGTQGNVIEELSVGWLEGHPISQLELAHLNKKQDQAKESQKNARDKSAGNNTLIDGHKEALSRGQSEPRGKEEEEEEAKNQDKGKASNPSTLQIKKILVTHGQLDIPNKEEKSSLTKLFSVCGEVMGVDLKHRGTAVVEFKTPAGASSALARVTSANRLLFRGKAVHVNLWDPEGAKKKAAALEQEGGIGTKYKMCKMHRHRGSCRKGDLCPFAHHPRELVPEIKARLFPHAAMNQNRDHMRSRRAYRSGSRERASSDKFRARDRRRRERSTSRSRGRNMSRSRSRGRRTEKKRSHRDDDREREEGRRSGREESTDRRRDSGRSRGKDSSSDRPRHRERDSSRNSTRDRTSERDKDRHAITRDQRDRTSERDKDRHATKRDERERFQGRQVEYRDRRGERRHGRERDRLSSSDSQGRRLYDGGKEQHHYDRSSRSSKRHKSQGEERVETESLNRWKPSS